MAPFFESAMYFERRAAKARAEGEQKRLLEVATFYRGLSAIAPDFPPGYKMPSLERKGRYAARAEELRTMAEHFHDPKCRAELLSIAKVYEQLSASVARTEEAAE